MHFGIWELLLILAVVLIIFGPGRLPGLGSGIGNALRNFRKAVNQPDAIDVTPKDEAHDVHAAREREEVRTKSG